MDGEFELNCFSLGTKTDNVSDVVGRSVVFVVGNAVYFSNDGC